MRGYSDKDDKSASPTGLTAEQIKRAANPPGDALSRAGVATKQPRKVS